MHYGLMITISLAAAASLFIFAGCGGAGGSYLERLEALVEGNLLLAKHIELAHEVDAGILEVLYLLRQLFVESLQSARFSA